MDLIEDRIFRWTTPLNRIESVSHLRLYTDPTPSVMLGSKQGAGRRVVAVLGELSDNPGMSITNGWEHLGPQVRAEVERLVPGAALTLVEHYPPDPDRDGWGAITGTFDLVTLDADNRPSWSPASQGFVENLMVDQQVACWPHEQYTAAMIEGRQPTGP